MTDQSKIKILVAYPLESMEMVTTVTMGLMAALSLLNHLMKLCMDMDIVQCNGEPKNIVNLITFLKV